MTLYDINKGIAACMTVDEDTGEVFFDEEQFAKLTEEREVKLENIACWIKDLKAESDAIAWEVKKLNVRKAAIDKKLTRLKAFLQEQLNGETLSSARVAVSYRKSKAVETTPEFIEWAWEHNQGLLNIKPEADKVKVRAALDAGAELPGAAIVEHINMQIK